MFVILANKENLDDELKQFLYLFSSVTQKK